MTPWETSKALDGKPPYPPQGSDEWRTAVPPLTPKTVARRADEPTERKRHQRGKK